MLFVVHIMQFFAKLMWAGIKERSENLKQIFESYKMKYIQVQLTSSCFLKNPLPLMKVGKTQENLSCKGSRASTSTLIVDRDNFSLDPERSYVSG